MAGCESAYIFRGSGLNNKIFIYEGIYNGRAYYYCVSIDYYMWWDGVSKWIVSPVLGDPSNAWAEAEIDTQCPPGTWWDIIGQEYIYLYPLPGSSSSSSSSTESTGSSISTESSTSSNASTDSSSSMAFSEESSLSSIVCCQTPSCYGDATACSHFSSWNFSGTLDRVNSNGCTLYLDIYGDGTQEIFIYRDAGRTEHVASGISDSSGSPELIYLNESNGSGLNGSVDWDGNIQMSNTLYLSCIAPA